MFGYTGIWHQEARKLDIRYDRYDVLDYGLPAKAGGDVLRVEGPVLEKEPRNALNARMLLTLDNMGVFGNQGSAYSSPSEADEHGMYDSLLTSSIALTLGENRIQENIRVGERILFKADYKVKTSYEQIPLAINLDGFSLDDVEKGYIRSDATHFDFKGASPKGFRMSIKKWEEGRGFVRPIYVEDIQPDESGRFSIPVDLAEGKGLYRIDILTPETHPRVGIVYFEAGHFYIGS